MTSIMAAQFAELDAHNRILIGMVAGFTSERWPDSSWNTRPDNVGIRSAITETGITKTEARAPRRRRVFCLAVTSEVGLARGRPSSWSAAVDQLCYGGGDRRRLMVVAAGNLRGDIEVDG